MRGFILVAMVALLAAAACGDDDGPDEPGTDAPALEVTSPVFTEGAAIPRVFTCDGEDTSIPLSWDAGPEGTQAYAIVFDDPDADGFAHWVVANIPASQRSVGAGASGDLGTGGVVEGENSFGNVGYGGPCPPEGQKAHEYRATVFALDATVDATGLARETLYERMEGHVLARGELKGTYGR